MRTRNHVIILAIILLLIALMTVEGNNIQVAAQSCTASLGSSTLSTTHYYYNSNIGIILPVSASCSFTGGQLYAVGNAYDTQVNTNLGSVSTILNSIYGGTFNGQLVFNLPPSILGHPIRILVSIYDSKPLGNGNDLLLTTAAQMVRVNFSNYQNPYQSGNCYQNSYCSYPSGSCYYQNPYCYYQNGNCYQNSYCSYPSNYCYSWSSYCYYQSYQNAYCFYRYGNYYCHYYPPNHQHRP